MIAVAIRVLLASVMLRFVYDETGPWTVAVLALIGIAIELTTYTISRLIETFKELAP